MLWQVRGHTPQRREVPHFQDLLCRPLRRRREHAAAGQRIYNLLDELRDQPDKTYLLVAHNGIARVVESYFHDMTNEEYALAGIRNCELVEYHFE